MRQYHYFFKAVCRYGFVLLLCFVTIFNCPGQEQVSTVKGPEVTNLLSTIRGYIVMPGTGGSIVATSLPSRREKVVVPPKDPNHPNIGSVHALSGPDAKGRIAYIAGFMSPKQHQVKVVSLDGKNAQVLFNRSGDALWDDVISKSLALSSVGGKVVFASNLQAVQMKEPWALLQQGALEIWDIEKRGNRKLPVMALDQGFCWFPDGKRLAYVSLIPKAQAGQLPLGKEGFGRQFKGWEKVPAVHLLDVATGKTSFLHIGWRPVVSSDGQEVLVEDFDNQWRTVRVSSRQSKPVRLPGNMGIVYALLKGGKVVYLGLPTDGTKIEYTQANSPLVGPKLMLTIKVANVHTGAFQTIVPNIDPRSEVSFGAMQP
jgi:hypothetical protein